MPRRSTWRLIRSFAKWACTVAAVLALIPGVASCVSVIRVGSVDWLTYIDLQGGHLDFVRQRFHHGEWHSGLFARWAWYSPAPMRPWFISTYHDGMSDVITVHMWPLAALFALPAAFLWWRDAPASRRRRAIRRNQCPTCGYSLAGLAPGGECPECGGKREGARREA